MQIVQREELIHNILNELKNKKMVYLEAPCGWGKTVLLHQLEESIGRDNCMFIHSSEITRMNFMADKSMGTAKDKRSEILLVDNLGEWVISGNIELLVNYIQKQKPDSKLILAGRIPLPAQLLPYKLASQVSIYGKNKLKYSDSELDTFCSKGYKGKREQFMELYELCHGMPLFLAVAEGLLEGAVIND